MTVRIKFAPNTELNSCPDCGRLHLGPRCGMTEGERYKSVSCATEWMPSRMDARRRDSLRQDGRAVGYYDEEMVKAMTGNTGLENKEQMLDDTHGVGVATAADIQKHPELVAAQYLDDPADEVGE